MNIHDGIAYEQINGLWSGYIRAAEQPTKIVPSLNWNGAKIPMRIIQQAYTWFRDVYKRSGDECQLRLFYNQKQDMWDADALPQRGAGLTTSELHDDPEHSRIIGNWIASGFEPCGTIHSHCGISAGQSGTDHADEIQSGAGPHITIGKLDGKPDYHMRVVFRRTQYAADLGDWVDIGAVMIPDPTALPVLVNHMLANIKPFDVPAHWDSRIRPKPAPQWGMWHKKNEDPEPMLPVIPLWLEDKIKKLGNKQLAVLIQHIRDPYCTETDIEIEQRELDNLDDVLFDVERYGITVDDIDAMFADHVHGEKK